VACWYCLMAVLFTTVPAHTTTNMPKGQPNMVSAEPTV
jgi:hypothetical protein